MRIDFVNHSSFIIREGAVNLMCDFWKDGSIFDNSWDLLCETEFDYDDFAGISHLWFSHEHPDHFSPANLSSIPPDLRKNITVLFQRTKDKRLISFCKKLGFADIVELDRYSTLKIGNDVEVSCAPHGADWADVDSWLLVRTPTATLLNVNDCEIEADSRLNDILRHCEDIDVLATQFSFASKQGDDSDTDWIGKARAYHLSKLELKLSAFSARYTLPFASFAYWSHQENKYLNQGVISVHEAVESIKENNSTPIVMFPEDQWNVGSEWRNTRPLQKYSARYDWLRSRPDSDYRESKSVCPEDLIEHAHRFLEKMKQSASERQIIQYIAQKHSFIRNADKSSRLVNRLRATIAGLFGKCEACRVYVDDHGQAYNFTVSQGLESVDRSVDECHIRIGSHALKFGFSVGFGGETLQINGRFQCLQKDGWLYLSEVFFLARRLEQKLELPRFVVLNSLGQSLGLVPRTA